MNFESLIRHDSKAAPGVTFFVRRMSEGARLTLRVQLAAAFGKLRAIEADRADLLDRASERLRKPTEQILVAELLPAERRELNEFVDREDLVQKTEINPVYLAAGLGSIEGLTLDGAAITDAAGLARVPSPELYREVMDAVLAAAGMSAADRGNSASPSTSGAGEAPTTNDSTAPGAGETGSTSTTGAVVAWSE